MKGFVVVLAAGNALLGVRWLLEASGVLQSGKYAPATSAIAGLLALALAGGALWLAFRGGRPGVALALVVGPWVIGMLVVIVAMVGGSRQ